VVLSLGAIDPEGIMHPVWRHRSNIAADSESQSCQHLAGVGPKLRTTQVSACHWEYQKRWPHANQCRRGNFFGEEQS